MVEKGANKIWASSLPFSSNARKKIFLQGVFRNGGILRNPIKIIKSGPRQTDNNEHSGTDYIQMRHANLKLYSIYKLSALTVRIYNMYIFSQFHQPTCGWKWGGEPVYIYYADDGWVTQEGIWNCYKNQRNYVECSLACSKNERPMFEEKNLSSFKTVMHHGMKSLETNEDP